MKANNFIIALKKKFQLKTDKQLTDHLGITPATLSSWRRDSANITPSKMASFVYRSIFRREKEARLYSIRPIVEYYPIDAGESARGAIWQVLDLDVNNKSYKRYLKVKEILDNANGIYIFYDSQFKALYVGKAKDQSIWQEMNSAFNRDRETQRLRKVNHPSSGQSFSPAYKQPRQITNPHLYLHDISMYFSAYEIERDLIENMEAMLVRAFANNILNERMEKIKLKP